MHRKVSLVVLTSGRRTGNGLPDDRSWLGVPRGSMIIPYRSLFAFVLGAFPSALVKAQTPLSIGAHLAYNFNDLNEFGAGGNALVAVSHRLAIYPSVTSYFVRGGSLLLATGALRFTVVRRGPFVPYVAAGPYWSHAINGSSNASDWGFMAIAGIEAGGQRLQTFVEVRLLKDGGVSTEAAGGLRLVLAR